MGRGPDLGVFSEKLEVAKIYGSPEVIKLATEASINADLWLEAIYGTSEEAMEDPQWLLGSRESWAYKVSAEVLLHRIRKELRVPGGSAKVKPFDLEI